MIGSTTKVRVLVLKRVSGMIYYINNKPKFHRQIKSKNRATLSVLPNTSKQNTLPHGFFAFPNFLRRNYRQPYSCRRRCRSRSTNIWMASQFSQPSNFLGTNCRSHQRKCHSSKLHKEPQQKGFFFRLWKTEHFQNHSYPFAKSVPHP